MKRLGLVLLGALAGWGLAYGISELIMYQVNLHARSDDDMTLAAFLCIVVLWPVMAILGGFVGYRLSKRP